MAGDIHSIETELCVTFFHGAFSTLALTYNLVSVFGLGAGGFSIPGLTRMIGDSNRRRSAERGTGLLLRCQ